MIICSSLLVGCHNCRSNLEIFYLYKYESEASFYENEANSQKTLMKHGKNEATVCWLSYLKILTLGLLYVYNSLFFPYALKLQCWAYYDSWVKITVSVSRSSMHSTLLLSMIVHLSLLLCFSCIIICIYALIIKWVEEYWSILHWMYIYIIYIIFYACIWI